MKLYIKQQVSLILLGNFTIRDEAGNNCYTASHGKSSSAGRSLHIYDSNESEVAIIRQNVNSSLPRFSVDINGRTAFELVKKSAFFRKMYSIESLSWHVVGNLWEHRYSVMENDQQIMRLSKKGFTWGASYELSISNPQDELMCICLALTLAYCRILKDTINDHTVPY
jgi:uncharacterized protein YxjI